jgi:RHS repeat-associated protein
VNSLNQAVATDAGRLWVAGVTNEVAKVTVNGVPAKTGFHWSGDEGQVENFTYEANIPVTNGENTITVEAEDFSPHKNTAVKRWKFNAVTTAPRSFTYDANGNLLDDGRRSYTWDAANRLAGVTVKALGASPQVVSAFSYDGAGRRVAESVEGAPSRRWAWAPGAAQPSAELNAAGEAVAKRFYGQGEVRFAAAGAPNAENFFYFRDHLGSVREVVDNDRQVVARLDYGDYGRRTRLPLGSARSSLGTFEPAFGYTGHLSHPGTGLVLTRYRAYDPETTRWLSRDPIWESGGMNLYGYVGGSPLMLTDPLGLAWYNNWNDFTIASMDVAIGGSEFAVGAGDALSFGLASRTAQAVYAANGDAQGAGLIGDSRCSGAYKGGVVAGTALGLASGASALAKSGALYKEIGKKTLSPENWAKYGHLSKESLGRQLVADKGWVRALLPESTGWTLGVKVPGLSPAGSISTIGTGPTVPAWIGVGAAAGAAGYAGWSLLSGDDK